jgi:hypothetical protein
MSRLRILCLCLIALFTPVARGGADPELSEMNGTWKPLSAELAGKPWPEQVLKSMKLIVEDDK